MVLNEQPTEIGDDAQKGLRKDLQFKVSIMIVRFCTQMEKKLQRLKQNKILQKMY